MTGTWLVHAAQSSRIVKDDAGKEFKLPDDWPEGHPLPKIKANCVRCHIDKGGALSRSVFDFAGSTHDFEEVSCETCHGGNINDDEKAHEGDFLSGAVSKLMERCATCHAKEAGAFNASKHFLPKIKSDHPICSTCHDNHAVGKGDFRIANACTTCHGTKAKAKTGEGESEITWTSRSQGEDGNRISISLLAGGKSQKLAVEHQKQDAGTNIVIRLATDDQGKSVSTAEQVLDAIKADKELYYMINAEENGDSLGEGIVQPAAPFKLVGGSGFEAKYPAYGELIRANDALWDSLTELRKEREKTPKELAAEIDKLRNQTMRFIHAVPAQPDAAETKALAEKSIELKKKIDVFLTQGK